jgi:hypothetical protein
LLKVAILFKVGDNSKSLEKQIELLQKHIPLASPTTNGIILNALAKYTERNPDLRPLVIPTFENYLESWDTELQQRAIEYIILCKNDGEDENMPNLSELRFIITNFQTKTFRQTS